MASTPGRARQTDAVPEPWALLALLVVGTAAVIALPSLAVHLPRPGRPEQAQYAATSLGVFALTAGYVYAVAHRRGFDRVWIATTLAYDAALVVVKFILSPTAYEKSPDTSLSSFTAAGLVVMPLYIAALGVIYIVATRRRGSWEWSSKAGLAVGLAAIAVAARLASAFALGTTSTYVHDVFKGPGILLPTLVIVASLAVMGSFERAGDAVQAAFGVGVVLVLVEHALWLAYMYRLFS
jgi:hypothetical protein